MHCGGRSASRVSPSFIYGYLVMAGTLIHVTKAGRAALVAAGNTGTAAHKITAIGVSTAAFDDTDETLIALPGERKRISTIAGENVAADTIHVTLKDDTADQYSLYGLGLYLANGVLFAVYSQAVPIMEKSPAAMLLLAADMQFTKIDAAQLYFGDATFTNPPATTERQGVVELATDGETLAGIDTQRAVTPSGLQATLGPALATKSNLGHRHAIVEVDGLQSTLDTKVNLSGGTITGGLSLYGGAGKNYSSNLTLNADGYTPYIRASKAAGGAVEFVNGANSTVNLSLAESGVMTLRTRPSWGATPWDNANFDPASRVAKTGDRMSGDLYLDSGGLHLSGWRGDPNQGVVFLNAANNKYVHFDGTNYSMPGAELYTGPGSSRVWHAGNFNPAAYQPAGNYQPAGSYQAAGNYLRNNVNQTTPGLYFNSGSPPSIAAISSSGNSDNVALTIGTDGNTSASAVIQFHRQGSHAAYFGLDTDNQWAVGGRSMGNIRYRLWHEGNFNPASYAVRRNGNANYGYVGCDTGNSLIINWDGNFRIYVDGQYGSALWGTHNFDPGSKANNGAQVQWASGIAELGGVVTGADITCDAGAPWVVEGLRTSGGGNRIYMRVVWLRNQ